MLLLWIKIHFKHMLKDLLIAADQVLYNLQISKEKAANLSEEVSAGEGLSPTSSDSTAEATIAPRS
jgi:hypothetical protein